MKLFGLQPRCCQSRRSAVRWYRLSIPTVHPTPYWHHLLANSSRAWRSCSHRVPAQSTHSWTSRACSCRTSRAMGIHRSRSFLMYSIVHSVSGPATVELEIGILAGGPLSHPKCWEIDDRKSTSPDSKCTRHGTVQYSTVTLVPHGRRCYASFASLLTISRTLWAADARTHTYKDAVGIFVQYRTYSIVQYRCMSMVCTCCTCCV